MAIFKSPLGKIQGSIGNATFQLRKGNRNVVMERNTTKRDPKKYSNAQVMYMARFLPASRTYAKLVEILNHAFDFGSPALSRNDFMHYALQTTQFPYLPKGSELAVPGAYRVTDGSLGSVTMEVFNGERHGSSRLSGIRTNIRVIDDPAPEWDSVLSQLRNEELLEGDQLTYIAVGAEDGESQPVWKYGRCIVGEGQSFPRWLGFDDNLNLVVLPEFSSSTNDFVIVAGCLIRTSMLNGTSYKLSSEIFAIAPNEYYTLYQQGENLTRMINSYKGSVSGKFGSQKYLLQAGRQTTSKVVKGSGLVDKVEITKQSDMSKTAIVFSMVRNTGIYLIADYLNGEYKAVNPDTGDVLTYSDGTEVTWNSIKGKASIFTGGVWEASTGQEDPTPVPPEPVTEVGTGVFVTDAGVYLDYTVNGSVVHPDRTSASVTQPVTFMSDNTLKLNGKFLMSNDEEVRWMKVTNTDMYVITQENELGVNCCLCEKDRTTEGDVEWVEMAQDGSGNWEIPADAFIALLQ